MWSAPLVYAFLKQQFCLTLMYYIAKCSMCLDVILKNCFNERNCFGCINVKNAIFICLFISISILSNSCYMEMDDRFGFSTG